MFDIELEVARLNRELNDSQTYSTSLLDRIVDYERSADILRQENTSLRTTIQRLTKQLADVSITPPSQPELSTSAFGTEGQSIGNSIRETVNSALSMMSSNEDGFVYDEKSGFYYDSTSQYYYDPTSSLYYNGKTGDCYRYDEHKKQYVSQSHKPVSGQPESKVNQDESASPSSVSNPQLDGVASIASSFVPTGMTSDSDPDEMEAPPWIDTGVKVKANNRKRKKKCISTACIRVMVIESSFLEVNTLYIITKEGACIGRQSDPSYNTIVIDDPDISRGKKENMRTNIKHLDRLKLSDTILELHIHLGKETCDRCEPGCINVPTSTSMELKEDTNHTRIKENIRIKKKFGLEKPCNQSELGKDYEDRAQIRRQKIGSDAPYDIEHNVPANVEIAIEPENKGHQLMKKMGWKEGECLGTNSNGVIEPINVMVKVNQKSGLGTEQHEFNLNEAAEGFKPNVWVKTQERYNKLK